MSKGAVNFSRNNEYYTPKEIVNLFGSFDYDPATVKEKAEEFGIKNFDTEQTDGLKQNWSKYKRIWINPPFTIKHLFLNKAVETYKKTKSDIYILLPIEFLTTKRFHKALEECSFRLYIPNKRIKFESGLNQKTNTPAFGTVIIKLDEVDSIYRIEVE